MMPARNDSVFRSVLVAALCAAGVARGQTSYPMLMSTKPTAVQAGRTSEVTVSSRYSMFGASQVIFSGTGVTAEVVAPELTEEQKKNPPNLQSLKIRVTVDPDAATGVRDFRLIGPTGASTLGQLVIVQDPVVLENAKNDTIEQAQTVELPATLCGAIEKAEDVDLFRFHVSAGTSLVFHCRAMRLEDRIHDLQQHVDPILTLRDANGSTLAVSDNVFAADPMMMYTFPREGDYLLEVRDVRYQGNAYWEYCVEVNSRPLLITAHPLAVAPGSSSQIQVVGPLAPSDPVTVEVPADTPSGPWQCARPLGPLGANPVWLEVTNLPIVLEQDDAAGEPEQGQAFAAPAVICGRIAGESDVDCFVFEAKKGESYTFEVVAHRLQSDIDSHLRVLDDKGKQLALADDMTIGKRSFSDSRVESWTAPADGKYVVEVRDLHLRGGPTFPYLVKVERAEPFFRLFVDTDKTQLTPGTSGILFVRVERKNGFTGEVKLKVEGLPPGVTASCGRILKDKGQDGCIVLTAAPDAAPAASNIRVLGEAVQPFGEQTLDLTAVADVYQETYQPGGGRGHWPVEMHTVAIGAPSDLRAVKVSPETITLKPGESQKIDVHIERAEGFDKNVTLDVQFRHLAGIFGDPLPPGVSVDTKKSKTLLTGKETDGYITLTAGKDAAPVENQQIAVMANVSLNFVMKATYASSPIMITVAP